MLTRMTETDNLVLIYLRRIDAKLDALAEDVGRLGDVIGRLEVGLSGLRQDLARLAHP